MTKNTRFAVGAIVVAAGALGLWIYRNAEAHEAPSYRFAAVTRGNLESTVVGHGPLSAVTHGAGRHAGVRSGRADLRRLQRPCEEGPAARAHRSRRCSSRRCRTRRPGSSARRRELEQAQAEYERNKTLFDAKVLTATEFKTAQSNSRCAGEREVGAGRARSREAESRVHVRSTRRSTAWSSSATWTSARPSRRACRRRSCS